MTLKSFSSDSPFSSDSNFDRRNLREYRWYHFAGEEEESQNKEASCLEFQSNLVGGLDGQSQLSDPMSYFAWDGPYH